MKRLHLENIVAPRNFANGRRKFLRQMAAVSVGLPLGRVPGLALPDLPTGELTAAGPQPAPPPQPSALTSQDDAFLNDLEHACFQFFWELTNPRIGLMRDRCNATINDNSIVASIASTGFGLTAICIGQMRGFVTYSEARLRVLQCLSFLWHKLPTHRGFYFHFANINTGERVYDSEVSSVDTAILLCGILTCRQYFRHDRDIYELAHAIFDRVDWTWVAEDTTLLSHGWTPELGFIPSRWDYYSELMMMYLLGMGSYSHPLHKDTWSAWKRVSLR